MSLADDLSRIQEMYERGVLTEEEFTAAKAQAIRSPDEHSAEDTPTLKKHVELLQIDAEINRLDHDWEREKQSYMVRDRYGSHVPTKTGSIAMGIVLGALGILLVITGCVTGSSVNESNQIFTQDSSGHMVPVPGGSPLYGVVTPQKSPDSGRRDAAVGMMALIGVAFLAFAIFYAPQMYSKAQAYESANDLYLTKLQVLLEKRRSSSSQHQREFQVRRKSPRFPRIGNHQRKSRRRA